MREMSETTEKQEQVREFWNAKPCDSELSEQDNKSKEYYLEIEDDRYQYQHHILEILDWLNWNNKKILEIGTGVGTDARQIIKRGGIYTGINIDQGSVEVTSQALNTFGLLGTVKESSATNVFLEENSVDIVYSFGVLHHIPDVNAAIDEIKRVLKPGGELLIMMYNRDSINYHVEIKFLRKIVLQILNVPGFIYLFKLIGLPEKKLRRHAEIYRLYGNLGDQEWLNRNTDGPDNPYSQVYNAQEVEKLLAGFDIKRNEVYFFDSRHWGIFGRVLPKSIVTFLGKRWGWHRMVYAINTK